MITNEKEMALITREMRFKKQNLINKWVLGVFLFIAIGSLLMRIIVGALLDVGYAEGKFHAGYFDNPQTAFHGMFTDWAKTSGIVNPSWDQFLLEHKAIAGQISRHPNFAWFLTQFTWLTTLVIIIFLVFRFFKYEDYVPRWLKWIMTQRTLSLVTMYDMVVGIVFWASMYNGFEEKFNSSLYVPELIITILVHAVIPVFMLTYSVIFLIKDKKASLLREMFAIRGLAFPVIYMVYYMVLTIIWTDPYPVTNMHNSLTVDPISGKSLEHPDWGAWASELWKLPFAVIGIYIILGVFTLIHNLVLVKWNKKYDPEHDYGVIMRKNAKLEKIRRKVIRQKAKEMQDF